MGLFPGEEVQNYPKCDARLPPLIRATLFALSVLEGRPMWRIHVDMVLEYVKSKSLEVQETIEKMIQDEKIPRQYFSRKGE